MAYTHHWVACMVHSDHLLNLNSDVGQLGDPKDDNHAGYPKECISHILASWRSRGKLSEYPASIISDDKLSGAILVPGITPPYLLRSPSKRNLVAPVEWGQVMSCPGISQILFSIR